MKTLSILFLMICILYLVGCGQDSIHLISEHRYESEASRVHQETQNIEKKINFEEYGENVCQAVKQTLMDNGTSATCATLADWREMNRGASHERASL